MGEHPEEQDSFGPDHPSEMGKAVGEGAVQSMSHDGFDHNVKSECRRRFVQSEELGTSALVDHTQDRGPGKRDLAHWGLERYVCNLEKHTVAAVGRGTLQNKWQTLFISVLENCS